MPTNDQRPTTNDQRRKTIGILAVFFLLGAAGCWIWPALCINPEWESACWRFGPILAVLWLAYDDLKRIPWWGWLALPVVLIILVRWPKYVLLCIPLLILIALLKPRLKSKS